MENYSRGGQATDDIIIRRMPIACWVTKATDTHSQYVIFIAFPRQQWLRELSSVSTFVLTLPVFLMLKIWTERESIYVVMWT